MSFINDDFMLKNETAKRLYAEVKDLPIIDYHCHISPKMIAENYKFKNANFYTVRIPNGVKTIGEYAFYNCGNIEMIIIPKSVTLIDYYAFCDCIFLQKVFILSDNI